MKNQVLTILAFLPIVAVAVARFEPPQLPPSEWADCEASTNLVFDAGSVRDNRWTLSFEIDAAGVNNAQVEFGVDTDGNGALDANERELSVGWDCGEWIVRDRRGRTVRRSEAASGRRRLEWTLYLDAQRRGRRLAGNVFAGGNVETFFNPSWNMARVVVRGADAANGLIRSKIDVNPLEIRIR